MKAVLLALLFSVATSVAAASATPEQLVRETAQKVRELTQLDREDPRRMYVLIDFCEDVLPHIDFRAMAKAALGPHWRQADGNQRARFSREFRNHLVRTYSTALRKSTGKQEIIFLPYTGQPGDKTAVVRTEIKRAEGGPNIPVNYNFYKSDSVWKMYDISIEGVSLVTTYRATYADKLKHEGLDALIAELARSNQAPPQSGSAPSRGTER